MSAVEIKHSNAAPHSNVVSIGIKCCEVNHNRAKAFLDLCRNGIEEIIQGTEFLKYNW